ncbi:DUF411 domain-containing protein [Psychrobacter sp. GW64-MNA-CIBAN-0177]|uniref:DUF411 domain-containing protein n=1 Tax=Psychrobacter sp. GW64-MNA-CIBAN-0177 TaxID=3140449 RepID=UPI00332ADF21
MGRYTNIFTSGHNRVSGRVLLLLTASSLSLTLAACSQANTSASDSETAQPKEAVVATQTAQEAEVATQEVEKAEVAPIMTPVTTQSTLLKNVSATVYKDPNCGCCKEWVGYAEGHGLSATAQDVTDLSLFKERYGVPQQMRACHTTVTTDGYVFEGHVPAKYMAQFLENPPVQAIGLAVPGMPVGSPGMKYQDKFMPYKVMQLNKDGSTEIYATIESPAQQL